MKQNKFWLTLISEEESVIVGYINLPMVFRKSAKINVESYEKDEITLCYQVFVYFAQNLSLRQFAVAEIFQKIPNLAQTYTLSLICAHLYPDIQISRLLISAIR